MNPREIEVHIGELVLHGFQPGSRWDLADALQDELRTLLVAHGLPSIWQTNPAVLATTGIQVGHYAKPSATGREIARAMHRGGAPR